MPETLSPKPRKRQGLTPESFEHLLNSLADDRDVAAEKYEQLRQALIAFFAFRGAAGAHELADETFNRVAGRLEEGAVIFARDPASYFFGVARNVWREDLARPDRTEQLDEHLPTVRALAPDPHSLLEEARQQREEERRLVCLRRCLDQMTPQERELIIEYYQGTGGAKIENRQLLADRFGISLKTLRNKTTLLRARLATSVAACLASKSDSA